MSSGSRVWVCVRMYNNICARGFHVCSWTASLYIYWNEQPSLGRLSGAEACSHASIYRLPGIRAWLRLPLPRGPGEVTCTETKFRRVEQGELSRAQIRGPVSPSGGMKAWNDTMCLRTCTRTHAQTVPSNRLRFVQAKLQLGKCVTCHREIHFSAWYYTNVSKHKIIVLYLKISSNIVL